MAKRLVLALVAVLVVGGGIWTAQQLAPGSVSSAPSLLVTPARSEERRVPDSEAEIQLSFAPIVKQVTPAVVNVYASGIL